jgi:DNA-binding MarR family transcriptional regulator
MPRQFFLGTNIPSQPGSFARALIELREARSRFFPPSIFGEPAWEMLLALYAATDEGGPLSLSRLGDGAGTPPSTALRWLSYLEAQGLVERSGSVHDQRVQLVELTEKAREAFLNYFSAIPPALHG